ncbi:synaptosomal-associated protein 47 isoform X2 [Cricetulus griseus]|uniref:Synaptosomal-associated protein 47 n=1 Tax=Cricetulus griseus TaxID=10029 RepID=A0A9J7GHL4_CRIGR|nr:synaptosomal-associated protein 47 isoform X2 [Cricetulus griseus]
MSSDVHVHSWPCSYYLNLEKQWVPGKLTLTPHSLKFSADRTEEVLVGLPLSSITEIRKESSLFIFSAITVLEKGQAKHWFSSLRPSRNVVFNIIEHFWRELLLSQPGTAASTTSPMTRGQELVGLMASSQRRMEDTSKVLHHQGEQLDSVMRGLEKMESDLDVADRLLTELESPSWWPFSSKLWKTPAEAKTKEAVSIAACEPFGKEGVVIRVPAIVSQRTESHSKPGKLTVLVSGLEIHDSSSSLLHRFEREDVDDIKVHSPYEVSIRQRFIGKPDVAYRVISAKMPEVIPILEVQFSKKIELLEDALVFRSRARTSPAEGSCSIRHAASRLMGCNTHRELPTGGQEGEQLQLQKTWPLLSEGEAQELTQTMAHVPSGQGCWLRIALSAHHSIFTPSGKTRCFYGTHVCTSQEPIEKHGLTVGSWEVLSDDISDRS